MQTVGKLGTHGTPGIVLLAGLLTALPALAGGPGPLGERETVYVTADDCRIITGTSGNLAADESSRQYWSRQQWLGACFEGYALGPGLMVTRNADGTRSAQSEEWRLYGRKLGASRNQVFLMPVGTTMFEMTAYNADNFGYFLSESFRPDTQNPADQLDRLTLSGREPDTPDGVGLSYKLTATAHANFPNCGPKLGQRCVQRVTSRRGSTQLENEIFPCASDCTAVWREKTGPMLRYMEQQIAEVGPRVKQAQEAAAPDYLPLMPAVLAARQQADAEAAAALAGVRSRHQAELARQQQSLDEGKAAERQAMKNLFIGIVAAAAVIGGVVLEQRADDREDERRRQAALREEQRRQEELRRQREQATVVTPPPGGWVTPTPSVSYSVPPPSQNTTVTLTPPPPTPYNDPPPAPSGPAPGPVRSCASGVITMAGTCGGGGY